MSPSQLREIFHVDHEDLVPNYEIVQLVHQTDHHNHNVHKRSINSFNLSNNLNNQYSDSVNSKSKNNNLKYNHHVKKDLSKIPYFDKSEYNEKSFSSKSNNNFNTNVNSEKIPNLNIANNVKSGVKQHNVSFSAFGESLNLTLKPTEGLFKSGPNSLKMWNVRSDPNATQGLIYEQVEEVSLSIHYSVPYCLRKASCFIIRNFPL